MGFSLIYFLNGLSTLGVAVICLYTLFIWSQKKSVCKLGRIIGINGILYLIPTLLYLAWSFTLLSPQSSDFVLIEGAFNIAKATLLLVIVYKLVNNKNLLYFLFLFLLSAVAIPYTISAFFLFISAISYSLILIVSMDLIFFSNYYLKKAGYMMLFYSIISILFLFIVMLGKEPSLMVWFIPNTVMLFVFLMFFKDVSQCGLVSVRKKPKPRRFELAFLFAKFLIFTTSMTAFILLSTISVHELGHALTAQYYGCERSKAVIYDMVNKPYTEMICNGYYNDTIITLGGIILTSAVGLIFFLTGGEFTTILSYLIFGFSFLISFGDILDLGLSLNIVAIMVFFAFLLIVTGVIKLSFHYVMQQSAMYEKEAQDLNHDNYFWIDEKSPVKSLSELIPFLHKGNRIKNLGGKKEALIKWIGTQLKDHDLASQIEKSRDRKQIEAIILAKLLKDDIAKKHILKYICYPLLKEKTK
jgi:hypothetical protein